MTDTKTTDIFLELIKDTDIPSNYHDAIIKLMAGAYQNGWDACTESMADDGSTELEEWEKSR